MTRFLAVLVFLAACKGTPTEVVDSDEPTPTLPATATVDPDADGYTASIDCDDDNPAVNPGATERCNGIDDDCNDQIDDDPIDGNTAYADGDGDGYGDATSGLAVCGTIPAGFITVGGDCDDTDAHVNPGATEACDDTDADCDGTPGYLDSDAPGELTYYLDADADGYGDDANPVVTCAPPVGYVLTSGDCDDTRATVYPGRAEACDNYDNDCNGSVDDGLEATFYLDADSDGYGDPTTVYEGCEAPVGYVSDATDCDDTRSFVRPGAPELCDTYDNDCDASIDDADPEGPTNPGSWYADLDGDGYGVGDPTVACEQPADTAPASPPCTA